MRIVVILAFIVLWSSVGFAADMQQAFKACSGNDIQSSIDACTELLRSGRERIQIQDFDYVTVMRQPTADMRRIGLYRRRHFRIDQLTLARNGNCYPFSLCSVVAHRDQVKAARGQTFSDEHFRNVAHRNNPSTPQNHSFQPGGMMRESKNTARGDEFSNLVCRNGKPPFAQPQQDERLQLEFGRYCHESLTVPSVFSTLRLAGGGMNASRSESSSGDRKPSGCTTGITV